MVTTTDHSEMGGQKSEGQDPENFDLHGNGEGEEDPVTAALQFDFFSESSDEGTETSQSEGGGQEPPQPGAEGSEGASREQEGGGQEAAGQEASGEAGPSEADQLKAEMAELRRQNQMLMQTVQQSQAGGPQAQGQDSGQTGEQSQASSAPDPQAEQQRLAQEYNFQLDPDMLRLIRSDDDNEAAQGIKRLTQGIGMAVHQKVLDEARQGWQKHVQNQVPHLMAMQQGQRQETDTVRKDFYGTYPEFDKPGMHQLVLQTAQEVAQEKGFTQWTPQLRDEVGQRMSQKLQSWGVPGGQTQAQAPTGASTKGPGTPAPRKPSFDAGGSAPRGPAAPADDNSSRGIADTLF